MSKRLRFAVVGCGDIAGYVAMVSKHIPKITITACVSKLREEAERFAKKYRVPLVFRDFDDLLENAADFDALYISTPHHLHAPMIHSAIKKNIPVLCEKPITESLSTAKEIVAQVAASNVKVGINYQYRYNPACQKLINYTQADIGRLYNIRINLPWHREPNYFEHSSWHKKLAMAGGGTLLTQGSHYLDIALQAADAKPISVIGITDRKVFNTEDIEIEDYAHGVVTLENGAHIEITSSMVANPEQTATIEVYGERGFAQFTHREKPHFRSKGAKPTPMEQKLPFGLHPLARSLKGFCNWVLLNQPYLTPIDSAIPVMKVVDAIYRSSSQKKEVTV